MSKTIKLEISTYAKITPEIRRCLIEARRLAMENTLKARIPECGDFGAIAQDLDFICNEIGVKDEENN